MRITKDELIIKGWSDEEIDRTIDLLEKTKHDKHPLTFFLDKTIYWIALILSVIGNVAFSLILIPLMITISPLTLYFIVLILSISFGMFMSFIIHDIEGLQFKHHLILTLIIPVVGIVNFIIVVNVARNIVNKIFSVFAMQILHEPVKPVILGVVYIIGFLAPYFIMLVRKNG
ncbi:MAG: hypothetical protein ABIC91_05110 [Nanoarchaeota archaeon]|nr:hypothetical protein [Nanoarchaeota archaeon]MBU1031182.1 hypothetical protein [Nanoarchaeota archaeon]MBU1850658.1 hypothetical protein [Nanoarchaeota archaeon]